METMKEIFIRKYEEASGKKCDETILVHMEYALQAGEEYAENRVKKALGMSNECSHENTNIENIRCSVCSDCAEIIEIDI